MPNSSENILPKILDSYLINNSSKPEYYEKYLPLFMSFISHCEVFYIIY